MTVSSHDSLNVCLISTDFLKPIKDFWYKLKHEINENNFFLLFGMKLRILLSKFGCFVLLVGFSAMIHIIKPF